MGCRNAEVAGTRWLDSWNVDVYVVSGLQYRPDYETAERVPATYGDDRQSAGKQDRRLLCPRARSAHAERVWQTVHAKDPRLLRHAVAVAANLRCRRCPAPLDVCCVRR